ncbi:hypothetical protein F5148DRAFT_1197790 [Russula earlei]|uniref:Uncharacterized protein n=1 Tax=Russula earlei TaxID=71964 RepID=A0ACC0U9X5_9AGAM|nr:hypothetical protein F5148DRAFT_1197790 [Russula earlei]
MRRGKSCSDPFYELGGPDGHERLVPNCKDRANKNSLCNAYYCSAQVAHRACTGLTCIWVIAVTFLADIVPNPDSNRQVSFSHPRSKKSSLMQGVISALFVVDRCFVFAQRLGLGFERMEEIIGCDLTSSWGKPGRCVPVKPLVSIASVPKCVMTET